MKKLIKRQNGKRLTQNAKCETRNAKQAFGVQRSAFSFFPAFSFFVLLAFSFSCNSGEGNNGSYKKAEDAQDAGRQFIRASLDGDYDKAAFYLLKDSINMLLFQKNQAYYGQLSSKEKSNYKNATIRPVGITGENDSTILYKYYATSNPADTTTLRIVRRNDTWLVDLKSVIKM
jgi:hypothetical protein